MCLEAAHVARLSFGLPEPSMVESDSLNSLGCKMMGDMGSVMDVRVHAVEHDYNCLWLCECWVAIGGEAYGLCLLISYLK